MVRPSAAVTTTVTTRPATVTAAWLPASARVTCTSAGEIDPRPTGTVTPADAAASASGTLTPPTAMESAAASSETRKRARRARISGSVTPSVVRM
ncbi:hypothetical protein BFL35_00740 [Clavibacter michiganensis]|nr:hypothetical protein BFL35_00740 [Clavibacter michiganensis]